MKSHDITKFLTPGRNTVAIKAIVKEQGSAGLVARIVVKDAGGTYVAYNTDGTWRTSLQEFPQWSKPSFNDAQWLAARVIGPLGTTAPWLDDVQMAGGAPAGRFETLPEFRVETVLVARRHRLAADDDVQRIRRHSGLRKKAAAFCCSATRITMARVRQAGSVCRSESSTARDSWR